MTEHTPLAVGDVVTARVTRAAVFGLFMQAGGHDLLLLIPETSWIPCSVSCDQLAAVGDELPVRVLAHAPDRGQYAVSHTAVYPDSNPWSGSWELTAGDTLEATVVRTVERSDRCGGGPGWLLALRPAAYVMLCEHADAGWAKGDRCRVAVKQVDRQQRRVVIGLAS